VDDVLEQLSPSLYPNERVLWSGRPDPAVNFTSGDVYLIPFGLFFLCFSIFWEVGASSAPIGFFPLFGIPFVLVGLYYVIGRFFVKHYTKKRTAYAITERRAIVLIGASNLRDVNPGEGSRTIRRSRDGRHMTVSFAPVAVTQSLFGFGGRNQIPPNTGLDFFDFAHRLPVAFYDVADVDGLTAALGRVEIGAQSAGS
jgi:hypothetical protein